MAQAFLAVGLGAEALREAAEVLLVQEPVQVMERALDVVFNSRVIRARGMVALAQILEHA
jgi:hypothetical protein